MSSAAAAPLSGSRTARTTWAPAAAKARAVSRPRPVLAPVTTATRPVWSGISAVVQCTVTFCILPQIHHIAHPRIHSSPGVRCQESHSQGQYARCRTTELGHPFHLEAGSCANLFLLQPWLFHFST
ncbi:Uncharacterised protein [Mycobacteroides abscessus subsp. abscessus]|nr:Uncharacterised protein [Mycobacteroides abscessus subsp. abscessus]